MLDFAGYVFILWNFIFFTFESFATYLLAGYNPYLHFQKILLYTFIIQIYSYIFENMLIIVGAENHRTENAGNCMVDMACPDSCVCLGTVVDCSGRGLTAIPKGIPTYTTSL